MQMKKKLLMLPQYADKGASAKYRCYLFQKDLEDYFEVRWSYFWDNEYVTSLMTEKKKHLFKIAIKYVCTFFKRLYMLVIIAPQMDVVFVERACIPGMRLHFLNRIKKHGTRIIFDVDDAVYLDKRDCSEDIARISDVVLCGNPTLQAHYEAIGGHAIVLPTVENTYAYEPLRKNTFDRKIIGWIGSKFTMPNLEIVIDPINRLVEKHPEIQVVIISDSAQGYDTRIKNCKFVKWDQDTYLNELAQITVGIMPLEDTEFNRGKCGFKLIQYLNMCKPVVGSGVGVNADIIGKNGLVAADDEWEPALETLLYNEEVYRTCQKNINQVFFEKYHYKKVCEKLMKVLDGTFDNEE